MTEQLARALREATEDVASALQPEQVWERARVRRRRTALVAVGTAAASVAAVVAVAAGLAGTPETPDPTPAPPTRTPTSTPSLDDTASVGVVNRAQLLPATDPIDWADLPAYPRDLGYWLSPERPVPLADDPVARATTALQYDLGGAANVVVIGDDGRWRSLDVSGLDLDDRDGGVLGLHRGSLSPDGTRLALGVADGVAVVDLTTARTTTFPVAGLGPVWGGRYVFWEPGGEAVLMSRGYWTSGNDATFAYPDGWRVDLADGQVSRVPFDPEHAALLGDGSVLADHWSVRAGHEWEHHSPGSATSLDISTDLLGVLDGLSANGDLVVARRELTARWPDRAWDRSGFVALDPQGEVMSMLPVRGVDQNGGGGRVVGWVDETVVVLAMPGPGGNPLRTVAWDVATGELWRGPEMLDSSRVSLAAP
ncbi:hypothetical protein [Nocardioides sp. GXQ0305]|uniref:hypothetical protein n=1 Tax=Nocardioides sp. GXQ0305 TaxID=3423912 RepID=UPI003D7ED0C5